MNFETIIGLEVHVELKTKSKMFSPSPVSYGAEPNIDTNVIDWGYPGVLPKPNHHAYSLGLMIATALHMDINQVTHFDRKNYFYPDNPKAYQITQAFEPLARDGYIEINVDGKVKKIGVAEIHVEEDAGKNTHGDGYSYVDLNRQGTALVEIVSKPEVNSPEEAYQYLENLRKIVQFTGASDVKMEEGSMRVDCNLSLRPFGADKFGTKTEIKNINSFNYARSALSYEETRQAEILRRGEEVAPQTRRWDEPSKSTILMRSKEGSSDYRYFPEPDIPPLKISDQWIKKVQAKMPEAPQERIKRYVKDLSLTEYDAGVLTQTKEMSDFFDATIKLGADAKQTANYLMGDISGYLNNEKLDLLDTKLNPENLAKMVKMITNGTISSKIAKQVLNEMLVSGTDAQEYVEDHQLAQNSNEEELLPMVQAILDENQQSIEDFKNGKDRALKFLMGQIMKQTKGKANPQLVTQLLLAEIKKR
ncbi:Asp-tRNA(Asn)/Glu-tRNA(Gln) amidotransferase subunit GatB [Xylocopilactobacillus apicola]|uniref:Aspartyl/glutamyl-tRNA(Asn/Gln) amidotransferase subunit B n=1 Tax=Xylocopilactobacillus apicola TaxID=2932184 RepID=A0AAU9DR97_9LACO|nr:Asp-tRNA(Asn)/Glu-tRNA(Gln) amidotransferase subunit GatB [Xylocopilactobacillus apicola]BDR58459.1 aspartyl/glutamyl-tRNA(Asn/Gln) amidotransferase subunit B [Xylocopilactobacillus apicola]